jgi:penicillin-binding protein 1A
VLAAVMTLLLVVAVALAVAYPNLPDIGSLTDYRPKLPLRVYSSDGVLLGEFGEERATSCRSAQMPQVMKDAVLAAEDARFYQHGGRRLQGPGSRGAREPARRPEPGCVDHHDAGGAQLLPQHREDLHAQDLRDPAGLRIESLLTKDQILELYMNQIFLGQRASGFAAAAEIYFGKPLKDVTVAEAAMLAGLPKAPSAYNPISNPKRAQVRQRYIIGRMFENGFITEQQHDRPGAGAAYRWPRDHAVHAEFAAENARHAGLRAVWRGDLHARPQRLPDAQCGRPGTGLPRLASRPDGLRTAAGLPRARGLHRPARPIPRSSTPGWPRR